MKDIHTLFLESGKFHGHYCPGLAIGVRAAYEALSILALEDNTCKDFFCVYENSACYLDGIQTITGCTAGKNTLLAHLTGRTAFSFFRTDTNESIRLYYLSPAISGTKEDKIEFILTAPLEEVFRTEKPGYHVPERSPRMPEKICSRCGESVSAGFISYIDEEPVCSECL